MGPPPGGHPEGDVRSPAALWITDVRAEQVDYEQQLRLLALNDASLVDDQPVILGAGPRVLDAKTVALVRLAALVGVGGAVPSYSALADDAVDLGATVAEIVEVLVEVISVVGLPRAVAEAPKLALAVGYDTEEAFEARSGP
jgi:alkylhydroperoxidase/carboxymuconolactone decarboxylase family protein YurZ